MSRLWPRTQYNEDQLYAKGILATHVLTRAAQAGALVGTATGGGILGWRSLRKTPSIVPASTVVLRSAGIGTLVGLAALSVGLPSMMSGREEIEWQDRSWRLLANRGQVECDDWTYGGMLAGAVLGVRRGGGALKAVGSIGMGSVVGMLGYLGTRYGLRGGWKEETVV